MKNSEIYNKITQEILKIMESGEIPWKKNWNGVSSLPRNGVTKKFYSGTNCWLMLLPYASPDFFTFNQIQQLNAHIKKREKGHYVVFWSSFIPKDVENEDEIKPVLFLKHYVVWNREQIEGLPEDENMPQINDPLEEGERIIAGYKDCPEIYFGGDRACYQPHSDKILCPNIDDFDNSNNFYATLFHECVHSTGSESRLCRNIKNSFGSSEYSKEELVAELGAAFLCGIAGISNADTQQNTAAYIQNWIKVLKNDIKFFFDASRLAGKAVEYITEGKKAIA